jgi:response regulator RpfG family c-di-GMP phosphodiesterase
VHIPVRIQRGLPRRIARGDRAARPRARRGSVRDLRVQCLCLGSGGAGFESAAIVGTEGIEMKKPSILAVDDTPANLIALESVLDRDFELVTASSGSKALEILEQRSDIVVVLMDVQMPIMDGYETATRIKKIPACQDIPIVFITAVYHEDPHVKRGYEVGGVDYFSKPFDPELLRLKMGIYSSFRQKAAVLREREQHIRETEELLAAGRKLSALLESLPVGVLIADVDGRICQTNDEVSRICKATETINHDDYGELIR